MVQVTFRGNPIEVQGSFPAVGSIAPEFVLVDKGLAEVRLSTCGCAGGRKILNIFPSIDTSVCAASVRQFNERAASAHGAQVLCISADLPFAQARFCGAEGIANVMMLSTFRNPKFLSDYGVAIASGPLTGLAARAVLVLDEDNRVLHAELVPEIGQEPNYDAALAALK